MEDKTFEQSIQELKAKIEEIDISTEKGRKLKSLYNDLLEEMLIPIGPTIQDVLLKGFKATLLINEIMIITAKPIPKFNKGASEFAIVGENKEGEMFLMPNNTKIKIPKP